MSAFATLEDVNILFRTVTSDEIAKVEQLLDIISDELRYRAELTGRNLDAMIENNIIPVNVVREVTVSAVSRVMRMNTSGEPMSQESQSALGYSWNGTYAVPGGGIGNAILPSDLKRLGLRRPRMGAFDPYDPRHNDHSC